VRHGDDCDRVASVRINLQCGGDATDENCGLLFHCSGKDDFSHYFFGDTIWTILVASSTVWFPIIDLNNSQWAQDFI
jgi:hypothetical protein